jgi:GxxExxY protein
VSKDLDDISGDMVDLALRIHREIGPGLLESVYETVLAAKLTQLGYSVVRQESVSLEFEGVLFEKAFFADIVVNDQLYVEIKSVERLSGVHRKQLLTCLRLAKQAVGLLINFGGETLKEGLHRVVNDYIPSASPRLRVNRK